MILLTGGLGFLGCNLAYYLAKQGNKLLLTQHRISRIPTFLEPLINKYIDISPCDILDFSNLFSILERYPVSSIIHTAALYGLKVNLYQCIKVNIDGTINILEASRIKKINRITFTSSQSVYQRQRDKIHKEDEDLPLESSHYISITKKACEMICDYYRKEYGMDIYITRPSQIYGPLYASGLNPLQKMVENSIANKPTNLPEIDSDDGNNLIYVKDCAKAIGLVHLAKMPQFTIYNVGDKYVTYSQMAEVVKKIIPGAEINLGANIKKEVKEPMYLNMDRLNKEFGFEPQFNLENGIKDYIQWLCYGKY